MVAQWFDYVTYVCQECNHLQNSKSIFMITDFKIFPIMLLRQLNFGVLSVYNYFTFIAKEKLHFSVTSFYCYLVKHGWALKVAQQFAWLLIKKLSVVNEFHPLTKVKKNSIFSCVGGPRYPSVNTVKLEKTFKNMSNVLGKLVKKFVFSKMKLACLQTKKRTSFPSKICPVF